MCPRGFTYFLYSLHPVIDPWTAPSRNCIGSEIASSTLTLCVRPRRYESTHFVTWGPSHIEYQVIQYVITMIYTNASILFLNWIIQLVYIIHHIERVFFRLRVAPLVTLVSNIQLRHQQLQNFNLNMSYDQDKIFSSLIFKRTQSKYASITLYQHLPVQSFSYSN